MSKQAQPPASGGSIKTSGSETAQHVGNVTARVADTVPPATDAQIAKWKKHIGSAKIVWSRFSDEELLKSAGQVETLTGMVRERYALSPEEAGRRVRNFLQQYRM